MHARKSSASNRRRGRALGDDRQERFCCHGVRELQLRRCAWRASLRNSGAICSLTAMIAIANGSAPGHQASLLATADATPRPGPDGLIRIWLDRKFVDRLGQMRGPGESYSDVIIRLAKASP